MRPSFVARIARSAVILQLFCGSAFAQPQKLYVWPDYDNSVPLNGQNVLDASVGGGPAAFKWGIVVKTDGSLAHWGNNWYGQSGSFTGAYQHAPCDGANQGLCTLPRVGGNPGYVPKMRKVSAGWDHNLGLSDDPLLWASAGLIGWGVNNWGQGSSPNWWYFEDGVLKKTTPWNIDFNAKVVEISAGEYINIVRFDNGQIAAWGQSLYGVHPPANGVPTSGRFDPYMPPPSWRFKSAICGGHFVTALILDAPGASLPVDPVTGRTGEGWVIGWGGWIEGTTGSNPPCGPGFRGYPGFAGYNANFASPHNVTNQSTLTIYNPPYDRIVAGHTVSGGIIDVVTKRHTDQYPATRPGDLHLWGTDSLYSVISTQPTQLTFEQVAMGYWGTAWANGLMDYTDPSHPVPLVTLQPWAQPPPADPPLPSGAPEGLTRGLLTLVPGPDNAINQIALCYDANCDESTAVPRLTANDFTCFTIKYGIAMGLTPAEQIVSYANCDGSTAVPVLTANDFICFTNHFALGTCP